MQAVDLQAVVATATDAPVPSTPFRLEAPPLSREHRRAACIHEAAHAVMHALGGGYVYRVAVAPEGATDWRTVGRKGAELSNLFGVCCPADSPAIGFFRWDDDECAMGVDRAGFCEMLRMLETHRRGSKREVWRQLRAHVCGSLAGPAADQLHERPDEEPFLDEGEFGTFDDIASAQAHAWLLPWRFEFAHLAAVTVATLRRPDVWALVLSVADRLEEVGDLDDGALMPLLPLPAPDWPPSPRVKARPMFAVTARGDA